MAETAEILEKIEQLRKKMHAMVMIKGMSSPEVLHVSQELDVVLNQYKQLTTHQQQQSNTLEL
ncbi:aspartyl-phosphate phosphatase Spo0E family protein [Ammoniphilus sp. CFH 90114]|uniref:aspartyl-phosphate phosphatase Spo0E family protein n=1 Tax=Ammoniphilus sp. CFH 90114 TaxID=2493665 RepID=UPI0013E963E6|nr:aspartyl-phosphate phosphatase Spo0E family protein [Ammoniphilus sp. CFH 90114]